MAEIIVALDVPTAAEARRMVERLGPDLDFVKVGLELYTREGPGVVRMLREQGLRVFLDLKFHDIPTTVASAVRSARELGVEFLTVHASGGGRMLEAALKAALGDEAANHPPRSEASAAPGGQVPECRLLAVTVLTSMDAGEVARAWGRDPGDLLPEAEVLRLAGLARDAGISGVVASSREAPALRRLLGPEAAVVTPGIRFAGGARHDQVRIATPADAVTRGASHLVMGRAITGDPEPALALERARREVDTALEVAR